jgi:hypothetical protein
MQRTRAANILYQRRLIDGRQALQPRAAELPTPMRRSEQRQAAGLVAGLLKGIIGGRHASRRAAVAVHRHQISGQ